MLSPITLMTTSTVYWMYSTDNKDHLGLLLILFSLLLGNTTTLLAQQPTDTMLITTDTDSTFGEDNIVVADTIKTKIKPEKRHSPKKAAFLSAVLPGAGQVYNRKYWKVPIIYGGFAGLGYAIGINQKRFNDYRVGFKIVANDSLISSYVVDGQSYSQSQLKELKDFYARNRNLSVIFATVLYTLNIIDAAVDAHLFEFDVSEDLSMRIEPVYQYNMGNGQSFTGIKLNLRL